MISPQQKVVDVQDVNGRRRSMAVLKLLNCRDFTEPNLILCTWELLPSDILNLSVSE